VGSVSGVVWGFLIACVCINKSLFIGRVPNVLATEPPLPCNVDSVELASTLAVCMNVVGAIGVS
jgi:hypothetical protein